MNTESELSELYKAIGEAVIMLSNERQSLSKQALIDKLQVLSESESDDERLLIYWRARKALGYVKSSTVVKMLPSCAMRQRPQTNEV